LHLGETRAKLVFWNNPIRLRDREKAAQLGCDSAELPDRSGGIGWQRAASGQSSKATAAKHGVSDKV